MPQYYRFENSTHLTCQKALVNFLYIPIEPIVDLYYCCESACCVFGDVFLLTTVVKNSYPSYHSLQSDLVYSDLVYRVTIIMELSKNYFSKTII